MYIIKIGGGDSIDLESIAADLAGLDQPVVVVLGANAARDRLAERLESPKQVLTSVSGYSSVLSDQTAIDIIMMSYAGLRLRRFVELCQRHGVNAVGLSGLDGLVIEGRRNKGIRVRENGKTLIKRDFSGKPCAANDVLLRLLTDHGYVPVLTIPIADEGRHAINSENDDIVNVLQRCLEAQTIVQLIEAPGFLDKVDDADSVVARMTPEELAAREQQVSGRMKRKMLALRQLFQHGAARVIIGDGRCSEPITRALAGRGTVIR
jgi:acetylglutamate/LysW-gamma-L-alpha-aminoadipate kinase